MDSNLEYCYGPHHIHEIVPNLTIIFLKKCPVTVNVNSGGGVAKCLCLLTRGEGGQKSPKSCLCNLCTAPKDE